MREMTSFFEIKVCSPVVISLTFTCGHSSPYKSAMRAPYSSAAWNCRATFAGVSG